MHAWLPLLSGPSAELALKEGWRPFIDFWPVDGYNPPDTQKLDLASLNRRIKLARWTA